MSNASTLEIVKYVESEGADSYEECMENASERGYIDIIDFISDKIDFNWHNCLNKATKGGHLNIIKYAESKMKDIGWTPGWATCMRYAEIEGFPDIVEYASIRLEEEKQKKLNRKPLFDPFPEGTSDVMRCFREFK